MRGLWCFACYACQPHTKIFTESWIQWRSWGFADRRRWGGIIKKLQLLHDVLRYDTNVAYFHMIVGCVRTFYVPPYSSYTYTHIFMADSTYLIFAQFLAFGRSPYWCGTLYRHSLIWAHLSFKGKSRKRNATGAVKAIN